MTKKDYILKVLDALMGYWPLARGLKILVEGDALGDATIERIVDIFATTIDGIQDNEAKEKLQTSKAVLEKIQTIEREQNIKDQKKLEELDQMMETI